MYGGRIGPSHESSIDEPWTKLPLAIITLSWYPGMSYGVGIAVLSIAEPAWMPWQNFICFSASPNSIVWTMSALGSSVVGSTLYPKVSRILLARMAVFRLLATTLGARYNPCKKLLFAPRDGPTSFPSPGAVSLSAISSTYSFLPAA